jgi:pilus assembly protein CpaF
VIRRPATRTVTLDTLVAEGALSPQMATVLRLAVRSRLNLLVTGGPGAGKTAFLAGLARAAPADERIVTVERIAELSPDLQHHVSLVAPDDAGIAPAQVLAAALVLRPDHLLVDGLAETVAGAIANAAAAGSNGIAASVAAGTPQSAVERFEGALRDTGAAAAAADARRLATQTFDMVVHLERQRDGVRRVKHIADLAVEGETIACRDLFIFDPIAGRFIFTGVRPNFMPRVAQAGLEAAMLGAL